MEAILNLDSKALLWVQEHARAAFATPAVRVLTRLGDAGAFWVALALILLVPGRTRRVGLMCVISQVIGFAVTNLVVKNWVARVRPYEMIEGLERVIEAQMDFSFPSGHATNSFACAWVIFRAAKRKVGVPALALAILIALSRVYVGVHYPTDILVGALVGVLSATLAMRIVPALERRFPWLSAWTGV